MAYFCHTQLSVTPLDLLPSTRWESERFFQTDTGEEVNQMITEAVRQYNIGVTVIQQNVEKGHKHSNTATISTSGCAASLVMTL